MSERSAAAAGSLGGLLTTLVLTFFGGAAVAAAAVVLGFSFGVLPPGRSELADPCAAADVAGLVPEASWRRGGGGLRSASCTAGGDLGSAEYIHFDLRVEKAGPEDRAAAEHERGCAALAGLGAVRPPARSGGCGLRGDRGRAAARLHRPGPRGRGADHRPLRHTGQGRRRHGTRRHRGRPPRRRPAGVLTSRPEAANGHQTSGRARASAHLPARPGGSSRQEPPHLPKGRPGRAGRGEGSPGTAASSASATHPATRIRPLVRWTARKAKGRSKQTCTYLTFTVAAGGADPTVAAKAVPRRPQSPGPGRRRGRSGGPGRWPAVRR